MDGWSAPRWRQAMVAACLGLAGLAQAETTQATRVADVRLAQATLDDGLGRLPVLRAAPSPKPTAPAAVKASVVNTETEPLLILAVGIAGLGWLRHLAKVRRAS